MSIVDLEGMSFWQVTLPQSSCYDGNFVILLDQMQSIRGRSRKRKTNPRQLVSHSPKRVPIVGAGTEEDERHALPE